MLELRVRTEKRNGNVVVDIVGALEYATADHLRAELDALLATTAGSPLVLDLSGVTFCDSAGLSVLVTAYEQAARWDVPLSLVRVPAALRRLLHIADLEQVLTSTTPRRTP